MPTMYVNNKYNKYVASYSLVRVSNRWNSTYKCPGVKATLIIIDTLIRDLVNCTFLLILIYNADHIHG